MKRVQLRGRLFGVLNTDSIDIAIAKLHPETSKRFLADLDLDQIEYALPNCVFLYATRDGAGAVSYSSSHGVDWLGTGS
jgi:hypothetical protein